MTHVFVQPFAVYVPRLFCCLTSSIRGVASFVRNPTPTEQSRYVINSLSRSPCQFVDTWKVRSAVSRSRKAGYRVGQDWPWDSSVGIVTRLHAGRTGVRIQAESSDLSLLHISSGAQGASNTMGTGVPPRGVKRQGREADHSLPSNTVVKNEWSYTSTTPEPS